MIKSKKNKKKNKKTIICNYLKDNTLIIKESKDYKMGKSPNYNFLFNKKNGFFMRCGENENEDPNFSPFGPE